MKLSNESIRSLKSIIKELYGLNYTDEQAQEAGLSIMRFVAAKNQRKQELVKAKGNGDGQISGNKRAVA